jgi:lipopolysaccharide export system protein LptA
MKRFFCNVKIRIIAAGFWILFLSAAVAFVQEAFPQNPETQTTGPSITITADRLVSRQADRLAEFSGNVRATQGNTVIVSDMLTIYFSEGKRLPGRDNDTDSIEKLIAAGNVVINHENRQAFCDKAIYTASDGLLVLSGERVVVKEEGGSIAGKKVILNRDTGEIIVTGKNGSPVEAVFDRSDESGMRF